MSKFLKLPKTLFAACALAAGVFAAPASAQGVFTVDEGVVPGALPNTFQADRITFGYEARIIQTIETGSLADDDDPFTEHGFLNKASFELGAGNALLTQLNNLGPNGYKIYGTFTITGEADLGGPGDAIHADFLTGTLTLFVDPDSDTVLGFAGDNTVTVTDPGLADDIELANLNLITGEANVRAGLANGDFDTLFTFDPTAFGDTFFALPDPFFPVENFGGNTQTLTGEDPDLNEDFVATATGAGVELFLAVPEPATLSLVGLALVGLGAATRRQRKSA